MPELTRPQVGADVVRNAVWDHLYMRPVAPLDTDVDVVWYDPRRADVAEVRRLKGFLQPLEPSIIWSVKSQARMTAATVRGPTRPPLTLCIAGQKPHRQSPPGGSDWMIAI